MHNFQLLALMQSLRPKELREIPKFLRSPFFNHRKDVIQLFDVLLVQKQKNKLDISKEQLFSKLYKNEVYEAQKFRQVVSWLQQLIEQYLKYQAMMSDEIETNIRLAKILRERDLEKHFQKTIKKAENALAKIDYRNADYYQNCFVIEQEKYKASSIQRMMVHNLQTLSNHLDASYIIQKLQQACLATAHQAIYHTQYDIGMFKEILNYIKQHHLTANVTIAAYLNCYHALANPERTDYFFEFKRVLFQNPQSYSQEDLRNLFLLAINFCIRQLNEGVLIFAKEGLDLYKYALNLKVLLLNGILSRFTFRNIVAMGIKEKDFDWVEGFIEAYEQYLEPEFRASTYSLNLATLSYSQKQFDTTLELLEVTDHKDLLMNLSAKTLAAKIYYELNEDRLLDAHLQTMDVYIRRKKGMGYHRKNFLNFIRYLKKMVNLPAFDKAKNQVLFDAIKAEKMLTERAWFIEKLLERGVK